MNNGSSSLSGLPSAITVTDNDLKTSLNSPGTVVSSAPGEVNQPNFLADKWTIGGQSILELAAQNQPKSGQNTNTCPIEKPFVDQNNQCIGCSNYYNTQTKSCFDCKSYNQAEHVCNDAPISNTFNPTTNATSGTNGNNESSYNVPVNGSTSSQTGSTTNNRTTSGNMSQVTPNLRVSNSNNLAGLLLPPETSIQDYKQSLLSNSQSQTLLPCPAETPFFDGTACISCSVDQYFSSVARVCQTCPAQQTYNAQTYHCETINFYSNPDVKLWTSIATPPSEILNKIANASTKLNAKPCPAETPYFNG